LAATLGIERTRLARLLHRLEARDLIQRPQSAGTLLARAKTLAARHERKLAAMLGTERHQMLPNALLDFTTEFSAR
jgi:DNA-binding MarR family transcriptional regulator